MFQELNFDLPEFQKNANESNKSPKDAARLEELWRRLIKPKERERLEHLLLQRLKENEVNLQRLLEEMVSQSNYDEAFYRYYHGSFKVYGIQAIAEKAVKALIDLLPERALNLEFENIIKQGTGKTFEMEHNREWERHTRPMLEAFAHAKFMIEMAVRYADLNEPPQPLPSGYAALLYLYDMR